MEKYTIHYENKGNNFKAQVYSPTQDEAIHELENTIPGSKKRFEIISIIPEGLVSGFDIRLIESKVMVV